jgi:hypothetical protein
VRGRRSGPPPNWPEPSGSGAGDPEHRSCPGEIGVHYKIRVRGQLSGAMLAAFPELRAQVQGAETLLAGQLPDQAALFGVLAWIEALGLELLEVLRTEG